MLDWLPNLAPLLGCGVMMLACWALMGGARRMRGDRPPDAERPEAAASEVAVLRHEVATLRA
ncbi:MAG: hypothetical protein ACRD2W_25740, partial [Acidimicrobiales bacterium]